MAGFLALLIPIVPNLVVKGIGLIRKGKHAKEDKKKAKLVEVAFENESTLPEGDALPGVTLEILRITDFPKHKTRKWDKRQLKDIKKIVIHHSATPMRKSEFHAIANYAVTPSPNNHLSSEGAPAIPYHFGIDRKGVYQFNELTDVTWGAKGYNQVSVHICCLGDFSTKGNHEGKDVVPVDYFISLHALILEIMDMINPDPLNPFGVISVTTHKALGKLACPGDMLDEWVKKNFK